MVEQRYDRHQGAAGDERRDGLAPAPFARESHRQPRTEGGGEQHGGPRARERIGGDGERDAHQRPRASAAPPGERGGDREQPQYRARRLREERGVEREDVVAGEPGRPGRERRDGTGRRLHEVHEEAGGGAGDERRKEFARAERLEGRDREGLPRVVLARGDGAAEDMVLLEGLGHGARRCDEPPAREDLRLQDVRVLVVDERGVVAGPAHRPGQDRREQCREPRQPAHPGRHGAEHTTVFAP